MVLMIVLLVAAVHVVVVAILLLLVLRRKETVILFIDAPDPDNPAAAMAVWTYVLKKKGRLHLVLTGRPVDLKTRKSHPERTQVNKEAIIRQKWEVSVPEHAVRVLEDSAQRIANYLEKSGVPLEAFTIYDGGVARTAPLSDVIHDWDFLFDRRDLVTGSKKDSGDIVDPAEYDRLLSQYCELTDTERERTFLSLLRRYKLAPLDELRGYLGRPWNGNRISVFLGGPATALVKLFKGRDNLCEKVTSFNAMFGSLSSAAGRKRTLLTNQFNAACDLEAAREVFVDDMFPHVTARLVTTETAKQPVFVLSAQEMEEGGVNEHVVKLQRLWEHTHRNRPQPMFDVLPVMAAIPTHKDCFTWEKKKALLNIKYCDEDRYEEVFTLEDEVTGSSAGGIVLVSDDNSSYDKESFIHFFVHIWK